MILKQIELENIKTHKKTTIPFKKGLNVFHGENGTGKSTILEMIGFVLFNYLGRKKHKIYVREVHNDKPEFGTVRLWVIGLNNEQYIIERTIGKPSIAVYNALTNKELKQISDVPQLIKWIRKQIGLSNNIELDKLFKTSIGIPQGTFIIPFQGNAGDRKKYFDPILDLKIYEVMWSKLKQLSDKIYTPALHDMDKQISEIMGEIKYKSEVIEKRDFIVKEVSSLTTKLEKSMEVYFILKKEFDKLREVKFNLEDTQQEVEKLTIKKDNEQKTVLGIQAQVDEAKNAKKICNATQKNSQTYEVLLDKQTSLQLKLNDLRESEKELDTITKDCVRLKTQEEGVIKSKQKAEKAIKRVDNLQPKCDRFSEIENAIIRNNEEITRITTIEEELIRKNTNLTELRTKTRRISKQVEKLPEIKQNFEELSNLEEKKDELRQSIAKIENKLAILTQNKKELEKGICPIFNQQCINLKEGTANYSELPAQIKEDVEALADKKDQLALIQRKLKSKREVAIKLEDLKEFKIKLGELQKQERLLQGDVINDQEKTKDKLSFIKLRETLEREKEALKPIIEDYLKNKSNAEELPSLEADLIYLKQEISKLGKAIEIKEKAVKSLEHIPTDLEKIQADLTSLKGNHELYQTNRKQAEQLSKREEELQKAIDALNQLESSLKKAEELSKNLTSLFNGVKFNKCENELKECESEIATLRTQISEKQNRVSDFNDDLKKFEQLEQELVEYNGKKDTLEVQMFFIEKMRVWLRAFVPKMRKALINQINVVASEIYRSLREEEDAVLAWQEDYDIHISTSKSSKDFFRLSGGEKMSAALAVRLAILRVLTDANFAFFDEPTTNLDESTRRNLSKYIYNIKGFEQLFVISHDDSFKRHSEYVVKFSKDENEITHIDYLTKKEE